MGAGRGNTRRVRASADNSDVVALLPDELIPPNVDLIGFSENEPVALVNYLTEALEDAGNDNRIVARFQLEAIRGGGFDNLLRICVAYSYGNVISYSEWRATHPLLGDALIPDLSVQKF